MKIQRVLSVVLIVVVMMGMGMSFTVPQVRADTTARWIEVKTVGASIPQPNHLFTVVGVVNRVQVATSNNAEWLTFNVFSKRILYTGEYDTEGAEIVVVAQPGEELFYLWRESGVRTVRVVVQTPSAGDVQVQSTLGMYEYIDVPGEVWLGPNTLSKHLSVGDLGLPDRSVIKSVVAIQTWLQRYGGNPVDVVANGDMVFNLHLDRASGTMAVGSDFEFLILQADTDHLDLALLATPVDRAYFRCGFLRVFYLKPSVEDTLIPTIKKPFPGVVRPQT